MKKSNSTYLPLRIEELLCRGEIAVDSRAIMEQIDQKVVLITGAGGSIGSEIVRQLAEFGARKIILFEVAETPLHDLQLELSQKFPTTEFIYTLGDIRSRQHLGQIIEQHRPLIIFHSAAYKHVPMIESNPCQGVLTNVWGTMNVAQCAMENGVEKFVMISTDKAINPTNVMGATKRIAEIYIQSISKTSPTEFLTTRFGNVLGSNGSVIPLFWSQIQSGGPITVTHPDITRYFMTITEACRLVLQAACIGHSGDILVFDMGQPVRIVELANRMIQMAGLRPGVDIGIEYIGLRPGEKLYEELFNPHEDIATSHTGIYIARGQAGGANDINEGNPSAISTTLDAMIASAKQNDAPTTVGLMKRLVAEFKSENSEFEQLDKMAMEGCEL